VVCVSGCSASVLPTLGLEAAEQMEAVLRGWFWLAVAWLSAARRNVNPISVSRSFL